MVNKIFGGISKYICSISTILICFCTVIYAINSLTRFFFNSFMGWLEEAICYLVCIMVWLLLQTLDYEDKNLRIDFLYEIVKDNPVLKKIFDIFGAAFNLFVSGVLLYAGYYSVYQALTLSTKNIGTGWPYIYLYGSMYAGLILFTLFWVYKLLASVLQRGVNNE